MFCRISQRLNLRSRVYGFTDRCHPAGARAQRSQGTLRNQTSVVRMRGAPTPDEVRAFPSRPAPAAARVRFPPTALRARPWLGGPRAQNTRAGIIVKSSHDRGATNV